MNPRPARGCSPCRGSTGGRQAPGSPPRRCATYRNPDQQRAARDHPSRALKVPGSLRRKPGWRGVALTGFRGRDSTRRRRYLGHARGTSERRPGALVHVLAGKPRRAGSCRPACGRRSPRRSCGSAPRRRTTKSAIAMSSERGQEEPRAARVRAAGGATPPRRRRPVGARRPPSSRAAPPQSAVPGVGEPRSLDVCSRHRDLLVQCAGSKAARHCRRAPSAPSTQALSTTAVPVGSAAMTARAFGVAPSGRGRMRRWIGRDRCDSGWSWRGCVRARASSSGPGEIVMDSRIELTVDPALFLHRVGAAVEPTTDLGHVQSGQFVGYLFPMAPWFAGPRGSACRCGWRSAVDGRAARDRGLGGGARHGRALQPRARGSPMSSRALIFAVNPYVVSFASRATVALLAHAAAALADRRRASWPGRAPTRRWRWPAVTGIALACSGGGVNAALLPWIIAAPVGLIALRVADPAGADTPRRCGPSGGGRRCAPCWGRCGGSCPSRSRVAYGANFLAFIEQPQTIWATPSMSESLRLLGYWIFYFWTGYGARNSRCTSPPRPTCSTFR